jgi:hypothetical protein
MIASDVSVPSAIDSDGLTRVVTISWTIVMPNPKLISIRRILDCSDIVIRTGFHALPGDIHVSRRIQCQPVSVIIVV